MDTRWIIDRFGAFVVVATLFSIAVRAYSLRDAEGVHFDFAVFHLAGREFWDGGIAALYDEAHIKALQGREEKIFLWAYPPPFAFMVAPLGLMPMWLAYTLFASATVLPYYILLSRLSGDDFRLLAIVMGVPLYGCTMIGQNGALIGLLLGLSALLFLKDRAAAGIPLGLMAVKPHLGVLVGLHAIAERRWGAVAAAGIVVVAMVALATVVFGPEIWPAFLDGSRTAAASLEEGKFRLYIMLSVYASLLSAGVPAALAAAAQAVATLVVLAMVVDAALRGLPRRRSLGLAALGALLVSPYAYFYDFAVFGIGLALLVGELPPAARRWVLLLAFAGGTWGPIVAMLPDDWTVRFTPAGPLLLADCVVAWRALRRPATQAEPMRAETAGGVG